MVGLYILFPLKEGKTPERVDPATRLPRKEMAPLALESRPDIRVPAEALYD